MAQAGRTPGIAILELSLSNDLAELAVAAEHVDRFCAEHGVSPDIAFAVNLSVDELLTNTINYGYPGGGSHRIAMTVRLDGGMLRVEIVDDARPYDPTTAPHPDIDAPMEQRPIGGLGVRFVRELMDGFGYHRGERRNIVALTKETGNRGATSRRRRRAGLGCVGSRHRKALWKRPSFPVGRAGSARQEETVKNRGRGFQTEAGAGPGRKRSRDGNRMELTTERHKDVLTVGVAGRVDGSDATAFAEALQDAVVPTDRAVIMDFGELAYINSAGLDAVVVTAKSLRGQDARLALCGLSEPIRNLFRISGLDKFLPIHDSRAEARASIDG